MTYLSGNVDNLIKSDISTVLNVFLQYLGGSLRALTIRAEAVCLQSHFSLGLSVLNGQFHCNPQTLPIISCLGEVITNFCWRKTQEADLGGQDRHSTNFPISAPQVHDFDLTGVGILNLGGMAEVAGVRMNPNSRLLKTAAPLPPLSQKPKSPSFIILDQPSLSCNPGQMTMLKVVSPICRTYSEYISEEKKTKTKN